MEGKIRISEYPQLQFICWQRNNEFVEERDALALYEANWRFIIEEDLTEKERLLIDRLVQFYGNGVLNV